MTTDIHHINTLDKIFIAELISGSGYTDKRNRVSKIVIHLENCHCCRLDVIELSDLYIACDLMPKQHSETGITCKKSSGKVNMVVQVMIIATQLLICAVVVKTNRFLDRFVR